MKFYLSSYKLGNQTEKLKMFVPHGRIGYVPNAGDYSTSDPQRSVRRTEENIELLSKIGLYPEVVDLREYFYRKEDLKKKLEEIGSVFVCGGNVFVLRQAMKLSGFDEILMEFQSKDCFLYAGYSAAGCVLSPNLKGYEIVDPVDTPYSEMREVIWDGLGFIDYMFLPHWNSDHPESADIEKELEYCRKNNLPYRVLRDGEVIIIE